MIKKLFTTLAVVLMLATVSMAQWTNTGAFPDTSWSGSTHGIAVDPDGKVWVSSYYHEIPWIVGEDTTYTSGIYVFNPDGSQAPFSPINIVATGGGFVLDTLDGAQRGMASDENGNIIYVQSGPSMMLKINYQTGEGMARHVFTELGSSPTSPGVADDGTVFVGPVVGGGTTAIAMFDTDLEYIGNAVVGPPNISRTLEVSADGNTIYWHAFTGIVATVVYQRPDEFSPFDSVATILDSLSVETSKWNADGKLYVSNDNRYNQTHVETLTWYAVDPATYEYTRAFSFESKVPGAADQYPRGLAFTEDGNTAYFGTFSAVQDRMQKAIKGEVPAVSIEFVCDMSVQVDAGQFDPATGTVTVAGSFNGWDPNASPLTDGDGDLKYSATIEGFTPGETIEFKFVKNGDGWESIANRTYTVPSENSTYEALFNDFAGGTDVSVTFFCNMEYEIASGRFNTSDDVLSARGSFNGWSSDDVMAPSLGDPNIYEVTVNMQVNEGDIIYYKYAFNYGTGGTNWEGGSDKTYEFTAADLTNGYAEIFRTYNDLGPGDVLGQPATIKFVCDMNGAINNLTGTTFTEMQNVFIAGAVPPLNWPGGGWPDSDVGLVHFLVDDGTGGDVTSGDNKWTVELTFPIYSPLTIQYKYGANWGLPSNGGANDNEAGVGEDHFLTIPHYLEYGVIENQFGVTGDHELTTDLREIEGAVPTQYSLDQNYPNPFNPTTIIRFSIPEASNVTLKIYDLLGQEVATLVDEFKNAGSYEINFDASQLTTGMYVYTIQSGKFVATKKMMLVK